MKLWPAIPVLCAAVLTACLKPPAAPSWETQLSIPLLNKSYYAYELEDSTDFVIEDDSLFYIQQGDIESQDLATQMNINARPSQYVWAPLPASGSYGGSLNIDETGWMDDDIAISYGRVDTWTLQFAFQNVDADLQSVTVTFDDIYTPEGDPLSVVITSFSNVTAIDLSADEAHGRYYTIGLPENTTLYEELTYTAQITSASGAPSPVAEMKVFFEGHIYFNLLYGMVYNKVLPINDYVVNINVDYPAGCDSAVVFAQAASRLEMKIWNRLGFPVELHGRLTAYNDNGEQRSMVLDHNDHLVFDGATAIYDSLLSSQALQDSVSWLLNLFPSRIELTDAFFYVGIDESQVGFAYSGSGARGIFEGKVPFLFQLTGKPMYLPEPVENHVSRKNRDYITDYAKSGEISFTVQNVYPASAQTEIFLSTSANEDTLYHAPTLLFPRQGEDGYVPSGQTVTLTYALTQDDVAFFASDTLYVGMRFTFDETTEDIYVAPSDYLRLTGHTTIQLFIDNE